MYKLLRCFILTVLQCWTLSSYSFDWETKAPEFTNSWVLKNDIIYYRAGCRGQQRIYNSQNSSADSLAINAPYNDPYHEEPQNCSWRVLNVKPGLWKPETFPGTYDEWKSIENNRNPQQPVPQIYSRACFNEAGEEKGRDEIITYPIYQCPTGTETRDDGWSQGPYGCYLNRELCRGDVIARDLDSLILWYVGHVGIVTGVNSEITEILNNDEYPYGFRDSSKVIQKNSFHSFAFNTNTSFWGAAYNALKSGYLDSWAGFAIEYAARDQYNAGYFVARYSLFPIAKPYQEKKYYFYDRFFDKFLENYGSSAPWFRCDTFIKYVYAKALDDSLTTANKTLTPKKIFNAFLNVRETYPERVVFK